MRPNIVFSRDPQDHRQQRNELSHAFNGHSLNEAQAVIEDYTELFITQLGEKGGPETKGVDVSIVYNWLTFDIIGKMAPPPQFDPSWSNAYAKQGHLTFGEPFDCVKEWKHSEWVTLILDFAAQLSFGTVLNRLSVPTFCVSLFLPTTLKNNLISHDRVTDGKIFRLIQDSKAQDDKHKQSLQKSYFFDRTIRESEFDPVHLREQAKVMMLAGSETTATFLAGITYLLLKNPETLVKLQNEVRSAFTSKKEITKDSTLKLQYLSGVIGEGLRLFPPAPFGLPRVCPPGAMIDGCAVPEGTVVSVDSFAMSHDARNFSDPDVIMPSANSSLFTVEPPDKYKPFRSPQHVHDLFDHQVKEIKKYIGGKELSIAVPGLGHDMVAYTSSEVPHVNDSVDCVNVMTYDLMNRRDHTTTHRTSILGPVSAIDKYISLDFPASKLVAGIPSYVKWFTTKKGYTCTQPIGCPTERLEEPDGSDTGKSGSMTFEAANFAAPPNTHITTPDNTCGVGKAFKCAEGLAGGPRGRGDGSTPAHCGTGCKFPYGKFGGIDISRSFHKALKNGYTDGENGAQWYWDAETSIFWSWDTPTYSAKDFVAG
ncbi:Cytochrome P450 monooxygenase BOA3 [Fusarium oxysporum f. sp. raphani]|uniref:Cytochrome P450 monooxygenase BOA3 n=1 Tax=Fusarium oxysporum f. sp. raphani TaxID=96318 RepID=A0A8J5PLJ0_FUSOX|nr:Cytochrome P450 monooxygenase BOA3 [Fusarium oxysporum f. sp. raphani]